MIKSRIKQLQQNVSNLFVYEIEGSLGQNNIKYYLQIMVSEQ